MRRARKPREDGRAFDRVSCGRCGYDLAAVTPPDATSGTCPECGRVQRIAPDPGLVSHRAVLLVLSTVWALSLVTCFFVPILPAVVTLAGALAMAPMLNLPPHERVAKVLSALLLWLLTNVVLYLVVLLGVALFLAYRRAAMG